MNTTRTLAVAALAALSLSAGSAMAQGLDGQSGVRWTQSHSVTSQPTIQSVTRETTQVQSGSSDVYVDPNTLAPAGGGDGGGN